MSILENVKKNKSSYQEIAAAIRSLSMDMVLQAKSGHIGLPLGCADLVTLLYFAAMNHNPHDHSWWGRDRFVLSAGHGSALLYAALHLAGYSLTLEDLKRFRQWGSKTPGHPEFGHTDGVECTTGPLGQGIAMAVGMALEECLVSSRLPSALKPHLTHKTYVLCGDGCLMEGVSSEASSLAGHWKLNQLIAFYDDNNITIDGPTSISFTENVALRYQAYGWLVLNADAHDFESLASALDTAHAELNRPVMIICKSIPGKGSPQWEGNHKVHGNPMTADDVTQAKQNIGIADTSAWKIPAKAYEAAKQHIETRKEKYRKFASLKSEWNDWNKNNRSQFKVTDQHWKSLEKTAATRVASGTSLNLLAEGHQELVGGSADLAGSNNTLIKTSSYFSAENHQARNIHFGVREHAMAAISNGLALGGVLHPYCATFAVFSDYLRPSLRLSALMNLPVIYILTHDSYAVGEDGPTHQPIEHTAALRGIPNLVVYRPADAQETLACWLSILTHKKPAALLLTRQDVPSLHEFRKFAASQLPTLIHEQGAYVLGEWRSTSPGAHEWVILASGSEVHLAVGVAEHLNTQNKMNVRVISVVDRHRFQARQDLRDQWIPKNARNVVIEAGIAMGWHELVGSHAIVISQEEFGASAPATQLHQKFGFSITGIIEKLNQLT